MPKLDRDEVAGIVLDDALTLCRSCGAGAEGETGYCRPCGDYWREVDAGLFCDIEWDERHATS